MRALLIAALLLLAGCASVDAPAGASLEDTKLRAYGLSEAYVVEGPSVKRTAEGLTTCTSDDGQQPCRAYYVGGWDAISSAIAATLTPIADVGKSITAMLLGRSEIPSSETPVAGAQFEGTIDLTAQPDRFE